jgi:DNA-directed RNA polymerase specialized sigma24 family protein
MPEDTESKFEAALLDPEIDKLIKNIGRNGGVPIDDLDDLVQEIRLEALRHRDRYDAGRSAFKSWIKAIAQKRVVDRHRRDSAARRRPKGGMLPLDPQNGSEVSAEVESLEARDSREPPISMAAGLREIVAPTNLTEKERAAVTELQTGQLEGAKSRARVRRATSKMQMQARTDDASPPQQPLVVECGYGSVPPRQRTVALLYELSRTTPWFVEEIEAWRRRPEWKNLMDQIAQQKSENNRPILLMGFRWPRKIRNAFMRNDNENYGDVRAAVELSVAFPEWPKTPFLCLQRPEVEDRLSWFGWIFGPTPVMEISDPIAGMLVSGGAEQPPEYPSPSEYTEWIDRSFPKRRPEAVKSTHIFRIDWDAPPATAERSFGRWYREHQKRLKTLGPTLAGRKRSETLTSLAAMRLVDEFQLSEIDARHWLKEYHRGAAPTGAEPFQRALRAGRKRRRTFLPEPTEIDS